MKLREYVAKRKEELDAFQDQWEKSMKADPENYPSDELHEDDWRDQEWAYQSLQNES